MFRVLFLSFFLTLGTYLSGQDISLPDRQKLAEHLRNDDVVSALELIRTARASDPSSRRLSNPPRGTLILYATLPGGVSNDGTGKNGLFTEAVLRQIKKPNLELDPLVKAVARDVEENSKQKQSP